MIDNTALHRLYFELSDSKPIQLILNSHQDLNDCWLDMHYEFEVGVLLSGRMRRKYLDHERVVGPGEVWLCGMWEPHGFELIEVPCELVVFVVDPRYAASSNFLNKNILAPFQVHPSGRPFVAAQKKDEMIQLAKKTKNLYDKKSEPDWFKMMFFEIMLTLLDNWQPREENSKSFMLQESIQPALKQVFEEQRLITTQEAASLCHMSVSSFRAAFKDLMGNSFADFALQYRIKGALAQLKNSNDTLETVALNWGFTDASHLHKFSLKANKVRQNLKSNYTTKMQECTPNHLNIAEKPTYQSQG